MSPLALVVPDDLVETLVDLVSERILASEPRSAPSPYLTTDQAAAFLQCSRQRIHDLLSAGRLSRFKEGRRTLVSREEVERLVELDRRSRS